MWADLAAAFRAARTEFLRVWRRRAWIKKHHASTTDPFTN